MADDHIKALRGERGHNRLLAIREAKRRKEKEWLDLLSGARYGGNTRPDLMMLERREERNEAMADIAEDASQHWTATVEDKPDA